MAPCHVVARMPGGRDDSLTPALYRGSPATQLLPPDRLLLRLSRRPLRPSLRPFPRPARGRGGPPVPVAPAPAAGLLERLQPVRLRLALPLRQHPATARRRRHAPLRQ